MWQQWPRCGGKGGARPESWDNVPKQATHFVPRVPADGGRDQEMPCRFARLPSDGGARIAGDHGWVSLISMRRLRA